MKPRIFFVGIHHKRGLKALDSKTQTGKIIDQIISLLDFQCIKTNLHATDFQPIEDHEIYADACMWHEIYNPKPSDLIVLLGVWVKDHFQPRSHQTLYIGHPAGALYMAKKDKREKYINSARNKIIDALCYSVESTDKIDLQTALDFALEVYKDIADLPGHEPEMKDLLEFIKSKP